MTGATDDDASVGNGGVENTPAGLSRRQLIQGAGVAAGALAVGATMHAGEAAAAETAAVPAAAVRTANPPVAEGRYLTTNQGVKIADDQNTLKAGPRGPSLLED